ncbi:Ribosomal large subunit pseudouridine synthase B [Rubrobacter xylanophilus DSM 9941]|uniref:pseudouridine synthase n=1 Tax=Rubrobacter xylanophilus TaxID=49319 RepID=UPI001C6430CC|nr:pseudouridine synthase [Rubrobacter xylanophilus]QYJ14677.1 Ribosomal large subunit pseudouridine synthase B [Rubrobacter xylanophilus DSM 9941]
MRLQAFLARSGAAPSRRKAEEMIRAGRVRVNGRVASLGAKVDPSSEAVFLDGRRVRPPSGYAYYALHKPRGYLTTMRDDFGRRTVASLMPPVPGLVPVGRLDRQTSGLLLLTNDGRLAHRITHPSSQIEKEYELTVRGSPPEETLRRLAAGPTLEDGPMLPPVLSSLRRGPRSTTFHLTIHEGRKRIIRRACIAVGLELLSLRRLRVGPVLLGDLPPGRYRPLSEEELEGLGA